ncbi:transcription-repair coupling factor [bacterium]|nr:transcription-repair coupling factor [bacterium]
MNNFFNIKSEEVDLKLKSLLKYKKSFEITGVTNLAKALLCEYFIRNSKKKLLFITDSEQNALKYLSDFSSLFGLSGGMFPAQDGSLYDLNRKNEYKYLNQISVLNGNFAPDFLVAPVKSMFEKFPSQKFYGENTIKIKVDEDINFDELPEKLVEMGYKRVTMVVDVGEFSIRGDIIDIYSLNDKPFRIELWGDTVTDIRIFDNKNQRSIEKVKEINILPLYKFILDDKNSKKFIKEYKEKDTELSRNYIEEIEQKHYFEGIEYFETFFNPDLKPLVELLSDDYIIVFDDYTKIKAKYETIEGDLENLYNENLTGGLTLPLKTPKHFKLSEFLSLISDKQKIYFDNFIDDKTGNLIDFSTNLVPAFSSDFDKISAFIKEEQKKGYNVIIATDYKARVSSQLDEYSIPNTEREISSDIVYLRDNLSMYGSIIDDFKAVFITDKELFNKRSKDITANKTAYTRESKDFIESINDIQPDDYVVHSIHGIGIFKGLSKQVIDGEEKDYLTLEYYGGDKLHIPAEQINMLARYRGSGNVKPALTKMGGSEWVKIKTRAKSAIEDIAQDLINLYAMRELSEGIAFEPDSIWQVEMEDAFEFTETPDQMKAILQTKADMESDKPMDRLICGDVGFGKTEVAIRAIFKAVMSSKQVALIAPTTVLALQHFRTISERFKPFPIKVAMLSGFQTSKEQKEVVKQIILGEVDVVIGTHRLLQNDISFKNLGLVVIDEEHKFGVKHKEKLKQLKKNIDILTMSATPIPRTLYMSLSGIKDMSVIDTPPVNRLPIKTYVGEYNDNLVKNAVNYELERDGQVFYLYNKVESIYEFGAKLKEIVPNASIAIAHGQMDKKKLENIMLDFLEHKYDILLCTTIIESGLDIPNANTMIIHDANRFGLAQLYQIRGRVGRTDRQAYCWCLYKNTQSLTEEAFKRLNYIREFSTLGSGYQIALRDIEIRGVGNILGTKQHGQMINVGFDTYCQLLEEAVNKLRKTPQKKEVQTIVDINVTAYIPDEWIGSKEQKMIEYKRLSDVKSLSELDLITAEWKDRFSKLSEPVENLIKLIRLRLLASRIGITQIRETDSHIRIYTPFSRAEWGIICSKAQPNITKYIKFTSAPNTLTGCVSVLLFDKSLYNFDEMFNILANLFYHIFNVSCEYNMTK